MPTKVVDAPLPAALLTPRSRPPLLPRTAHAAAGMELALQDDAVFVDQRWMERDKALDHAVELSTKRIRVNVLWARCSSGADRARAQTGTYDFSRDRRAAGRRGHARHQAAADDRRPRARLGDGRPPGRQQPARRGQVRRVRAHRRRALQGPRRPLLDLERAELEHLAVAAKSAPKLVPRALLGGLHGVKAVDPKAKVLFGELAPNAAAARSRR